MLLTYLLHLPTGPRRHARASAPRRAASRTTTGLCVHRRHRTVAVAAALRPFLQPTPQGETESSPPHPNSSPKGGLILPLPLASRPSRDASGGASARRTTRCTCGARTSWRRASRSHSAPRSATRRHAPTPCCRSCAASLLTLTHSRFTFPPTTDPDPDPDLNQVDPRSWGDGVEHVSARIADNELLIDGVALGLGGAMQPT